MLAGKVLAAKFFVMYGRAVKKGGTSMSRTGKKPIQIPDGVEVQIKKITISGLRVLMENCATISHPVSVQSRMSSRFL